MGLSVVLEGHDDVSAPAMVADCVGDTDLLRLRSLDTELPPSVKIFAKAEHLNPSGSVKDRAALAMIVEGDISGKLLGGAIMARARA